ncbi:hypothetical protein LZ31DRAFT_145181 [Colletotrichum somersetense]|nr:hypothetical protein LZ31DRAFT_145181 [Colletotrichum somersetense]
MHAATTITSTYNQAIVPLRHKKARGRMIGSEARRPPTDLRPRNRVLVQDIYRIHRGSEQTCGGPPSSPIKPPLLSRASLQYGLASRGIRDETETGCQEGLGPKAKDTRKGLGACSPNTKHLITSPLSGVSAKLREHAPCYKGRSLYHYSKFFPLFPCAKTSRNRIHHISEASSDH